MKSIFLKSSYLWLLAIFSLPNSSFAQGLFFERIYDETLSQASYVIGDTETKEAIVIDPKRDIDTYLQIAEKHNLKITKITGYYSSNGASHFGQMMPVIAVQMMPF